jgi:protein-S-isoprenylcysteine O-methyltransferase Ste14
VRSVVSSLLGTLTFFFVAPFTVAGVIPWLLTGWRLEPTLLGWSLERMIGAILVVAGLAVVLESFLRFAIVGRGTPAPPLPTERLVVTGFYRHVRNPMYLGVVSVILGQALLFGSRMLLWYGAALWAVFHVFVLLYEEPRLRRQYGSDYQAYCGRVRRWLPRARAWTRVEA